MARLLCWIKTQKSAGGVAVVARYGGKTIHHHNCFNVRAVGVCAASKMLIFTATAAAVGNDAIPALFKRHKHSLVLQVNLW